jgi:MFS family permease
VSDASEGAPGRWRALWFLALALVLSMSTWFSATAVVPQLRVEWGISNSTAAWLTIAVQLGFVAGALLSSLVNLPDVVPVRLLIAGAAAGAAGANLLIVRADSVAGPLVLRFLTGAFLAGVYPPALKLLATWFVKGRGLALGLLVGALTLGTAAPHLVNAMGGLDWRVVVLTTSALTFAGALVVILFVGEGPFPFPRATFDVRQAGRVFKDKRVRLASIGYLGHMWELYAMWAWFIVFFRSSLEESGAPDGSVAAYTTFFVIGSGAVGCWLGGLLGDRWGRAQTTAAMMVVSGSCAAVIGFFYGGPSWLITLIGLVWGVAVVGDSAQFSTIVTEYSDPRYVGTALTLQLSLGFTLTVATIWLLPWIEEQVTWRWTFAALVIGPLAGVLAMNALRRDIGDPTRPAYQA